MESILLSIKKLLGIEGEYTHFDPDVIIHINSAFFILSQLGVGPPGGFRIKDETVTWDDFIQQSVNSNIESIKTYIYMKVKLAFDPPSSSALITSMEKSISEFEWRLNVAAETS